MHVLWLMRMHVVLAVTTVVVLLVVTVVVVVVVVVVVEVAAVAVGLDPSAVGAADHALVVVLAPAGGHAVVVLEEVARLVHQRRVAPARQHEPLTAPVVPVDEVQVRLQVVVARRVQRVLEERRPLVVQPQLHADVGVAPWQPQHPFRHAPHHLRRPLVQQDPRHPRHVVVHVHHPQRLHPELRLEPPLERRVAHPRTPKRVHAHRRGGAHAAHAHAAQCAIALAGTG